jgi:RNA recognition motif-containing protein
MEEIESKVYVGNLPFSVGQNELKELFSEFGEITEATIIIDKFSNRSKGFGFVTFANKEDAEKAVESMNDKEVQGRQLKVSIAKPIDPDRPRPQRRSFGNNNFRQRRF